MKTFYLLVVMMLLSASGVFAQKSDTIIKMDGQLIRAKVLEINDLDVKYKKFDFQDGPTYTLKKTDISVIHFSNGDKEIFNAKATNTGAGKTTVKEIPPNKTVVEEVPVELTYDTIVGVDYDIIIKNDGTEIKAVVTKVSVQSINYKKYGGTMVISLKTKEVAEIIFGDSLRAKEFQIPGKEWKFSKSIAVKKNTTQQDDKKFDDRSVGVKVSVTNENENNEEIRQKWAESGGKIGSKSYAAGFNFLSKKFEESSYSGNIRGFGFNLGWISSFLNLKVPEFVDLTSKAKWNSFIYGTGFLFAFNKTTINSTYKTYDVSPSGDLKEKWVSSETNSSSSTITVPFNIGVAMGRGKFLNPSEWKGNMFSIIYQPSLVMNFADGESTTKFNPIGFAFEYARGGFSSVVAKKVAPKPHTRISLMIFPPVFGLPFMLNVSVGTLLYKKK